MRIISVFLCFLYVSQLSQCANILYIGLTTAASHTIWDKTLAMELRKNHKITFVSHDPRVKGENITSFVLEGKFCL